MRRRSFGLEWLDKNNRKQREWTLTYLQTKGSIKQSDEPLTHDKLMEIGEGLERSKDGQATIQKMRNAWRQMEYRAPAKGRKACTFKLKTEVTKVLASLAKEYDTNETDMLSRLICDGASAHAGLREQLDKLQKKANKLSQGKNAALDLLEFTVAMLCQTEVILHDTLSTVTISQDQERRIGKLRKQVWKEANADIAASADDATEIRLHVPGHLYKTMRKERYAGSLAARTTSASIDTITEARLTELQPVTFSKHQNQYPAKTKTKSNTAVTINSADPLLNNFAREAVEAEPNENASPRFTRQKPQTATRDQHVRYRIYASIGKGGVASAFIKQRTIKTDSAALNNHPAGEAVEVPPRENTSPHLEADQPIQNSQTTIPSPPIRDKTGQTLGDILRKKEEEESRRLKAKTGSI